MTEQHSTPKSLTLPAQSVKQALNSRWSFYISIGGELLIKQYATDSLASNENFQPITQQEYEFLVSEMQS